MKWRRHLPKRAPREWVIRGTLAAAVAIAGCFSIAHTLAQVALEHDPALAHRLAPWDGRVTAALAATLAKLDATPAERARAERLSELALRQDPTAVAAASTLGIGAQLRSDEQRASHYFTYAERLSRRELTAQLWGIEDAVARGDVADAITHYDIAMRTRRESWELLFPVLSAASVNPQVRSQLARTLAREPLWSDAFIIHLVANGPDAKTTASLLSKLKKARIAIPEGVHARMIGVLLDDDSAEEAWRYYAAVRPNAARNRSRDPRFTAQLEMPTMFDWNAIGEAGLISTIHAEPQGGVFSFTAPTSLGGPMLQQLQMLPPGSYRLDGHSSGVDQTSGSLPYWTLSCRKDDRELGRVEMTNSARGGGVFSGTLTVPADCPVQRLVLFARASNAIDGLSGQIDHVQLGPAR